MKQLEKLDKYVIAPNVDFYGGLRYDGEDIFLCRDHDTDTGYDFQVEQKIEMGVLITDIVRTYTRKNGKRVHERSHMEVELTQGQLLVYVEGTGFTIPEYRMCKAEEAAAQYGILMGGDGNVSN